MAHFFENAQELHNALMTCASTAPTEWDSTDPHVTFKAPHRLADGSRPMFTVKNTRARLVEFAQTVAKSPRLFGGGKVDKPTRAAIRSPWPAGAVKLARELLQDHDYAGALELAESKTGAMFYQHTKQAFMLLAPMECTNLPGLMSAQNESGVFVVFDPASGYVVNGRSLSRPQRTRAGAIAEAVEMWGSKTPEEQAESLARAQAHPCDQQAARAAWLTEHGIANTEDMAARIEAQQAQDEQAIEEATSTEATAPSAAPASTAPAAEETEIDAPVPYRGQRWTMAAAHAFIASMRAAIAKNTREIDITQRSRKAGATSAAYALEIKRRERTDMLDEMLQAVASASAAQVVAQAAACAAIEQASTSAAAPRVAAPMAELATAGAHADSAQVAGYATTQHQHPAGTGHSMGTTTRPPARPWTPPHADYTDPRETLYKLPPATMPTTTPHHMTGAELQTLRENANMAREDLADLAGVQARTIKHWESGRAGVPEDVADLVRGIDQTINTATQYARDHLRQLMQNGPPTADIVLLRYRNTADLHRYRQDMTAMPACVHGAIINRMRLDAKALGIPVRIVWMQPDVYEPWRAACQLRDNENTRAVWAAQQFDAQALPHRQDQPPPA